MRWFILRTISILPLVLSVGAVLSSTSTTARAQNIYVNSYNTVGEYTTSGGTVNASLVSGLDLPWGMAVSGSNLFIASYNKVGEYTTSGGTVNASLITGLSYAYGVAVSGSNLFVVNFNSGTIGEYTTSGGTVNASLITGLSYPRAIAVSGSNLFVVGNSGFVGEYTTSGETVNASLVNIGQTGWGIAVSGSNLFVAKGSQPGTIGEYTTSGQTVNASLITGFFGGGQLAVSGSNLFVANYYSGGVGEGTVGEYTTSGGTVNASLITGLSGPVGIAVTGAAGVGLSNTINATIITGGTGNLGTTVMNTAASGANNLNYTLNAALLSGSATLGAITSGSGSLAPSASQSCTVSATSTNLGINTISLTASDPNSSNGSLSTTATLTVLGHSNPALGIASGNGQTIITGGTLGAVTLNLTNAGTNLSPLDVNSLGNLSGGATGSGVVASGGTATYTATGFNTTTVGLNKTLPVGLYAGDQQSLSGCNSLAQQNQNVTYSVLGHSNPALGIASGNGQTIITGGTLGAVTLNLTNAGTNLSPLDVNTLSNLSGGTTGSGVVASGGTVSYTATGFNTTTVGVNKTLPLSLNAGDQQSLSGHSSLSQQSQNVTYSVLGHSNPAMGIASGNGQTIITGGTLGAVTLNLSNAGANLSPLDVNTLSNLSGGTTGSGVVASGGTATYAATGFNTTTVGVNETLTTSLYAGDQQSLSGHNSLAQQNQNVTYSVLGHSNPALSIASGNGQTIITGGTLATVTVNLTNAGANLSPLDVNTLSNLSGGTTGSAVVSSGGTVSYTATGFNTTTVGVNEALPVSLNAGDQQSLSGHNSLTQQNQNVTYSVLGHSNPALGIASGNGQTIITGGTLATVALNLTNGTLNQTGLAALDVNSLGALVTGSTGGKLVASGSTQSYTAVLSTGTLGTQAETFSMNVGDDHTLSGASAPTNLSTSATLTVLDHSNASLSSSATQTTQTINFGNVLRGATIPSQSFTIYNRAANTSATYTANLKLTTGFTMIGDGSLTTNLAAFTGLRPGNGTTCPASINTSNYTTTGITIITMSASQLADDSSLPGAGNNNNGGITITLEGKVGNATADKSNSQTSFGTALTAPVAQNGSYANLDSMATATTGSGGHDLVGSTATILAGTNSSGSSQTVSMAWRTQTQGERTGPGLLSDVVGLSGMTFSGNQTSPFVLQMNYDEDLLPGGVASESLLASDEQIYLESLNPSTNQWVNAVDGNIGTNAGSFHVGPWVPGDMTLGDWGVNTVNDTVWAVVNHNSDFASGVTVTPEPSTLALLGSGAIVLIGYAWRRRRRKDSLPLAGESTRASRDETDSQEEGPAILSMSSGWTEAARRAA